MSIRNRQIGWSNKSNLLYDVLREFNAVKGQFAASPTTTTTTTAILNPSLKINPPSVNTFDIPEWVSGDVGNFTVEWLQFMSTDVNFPRIYSIGQYPAQNAVSIEGGILYLWLNGSIQGSYNMSSLPNGYINQWVYIVVERYKDVIRVWAQNYTYYTSNIIINVPSYPNAIPTNGLDLYIGSENAPDTYYNGLISNFRFTINFNPYGGAMPFYPTTALPVAPGTVLLMGQGTDITQQLTDQTGTNTATASNVIFNIASGILGGDSNGSLQFGTI